ncbi:MAG TPA: DUF222 domain-containing protein [Actinomycetota bacterium]|nr:DUF222 domain-containing protein [Actinomycetota bacterium]
MFEQPTADLFPPEGWSADALGDAVVSLAGQVAAGQCQLLCWLTAFEAAQHWEGTSETATWLGYRCGMAPRAARELVALSRRLRELPKIREAFSEGKLCLTQVAAIARIATPELQDELITLARVTTGSMLARAVAKYRHLLATFSEEAENQKVMDAREACRLAMCFDDEGFFHLTGTFGPEAGAVIEAAITQVCAEAKAEAGELEDQDSPVGTAQHPIQARQADALVALCEAARDRQLTSRPGTARAEVVVHVDAALLAGDRPDAEARCELEAGHRHAAPLGPETARRISCDASVVAVVEDAEANPLSIGRRSRSIPTPIRRALSSRDGGCVFPGCGHTRHLEGHHLHHWAQGGETSLANLALLCWPHHVAVHEGGYRIVAAAPGVFTFIRPDASVVGAEHDPDATHTAQLGFPVEPTDTLSRYLGGSMNLVDVICGLYSKDGRFSGVPRGVIEEAAKPPPDTRARSSGFPPEDAWLYEEQTETVELGPAHYDWEDPPPR